MFRNMQRRQYCLTCSPYKSYRGKLLDNGAASRDRVCASCDRPYVYKRSSGHTLKQCNGCLSTARARSVKAQALAYKGGKCQRCGYSKCQAALGFHHQDPSIKEFTISSNHSRSWAAIQRELDKCLLVCANCHAEIHDSPPVA